MSEEIPTYSDRVKKRAEKIKNGGIVAIAKSKNLKSMDKLRLDMIRKAEKYMKKTKNDADQNPSSGKRRARKGNSPTSGESVNPKSIKRKRVLL